jgi:hypothetical protein
MSNTITPEPKGANLSKCGKYRYRLWRFWDEDKPKAMVIGLNPSTANAEEDDPTIRNLRLLLSSRGYGGFYMMNLFALVSPNPDDLRSCPDPVKDNDQWLTHTAKYCKDILFAWGSFKQAEYRIKRVTAMFPDALCFGKTANGKPLHPLAATVWMKSKFKIQPYV